MEQVLMAWVVLTAALVVLFTLVCLVQAAVRAARRGLRVVQHVPTGHLAGPQPVRQRQAA